jgi:hypothetical protein
MMKDVIVTVKSAWMMIAKIVRWMTAKIPTVQQMAAQRRTEAMMAVTTRTAASR